MNASTPTTGERWFARPIDKTSQTGHQRSLDITVMPPSQHSLNSSAIYGLTCVE